MEMLARPVHRDVQSLLRSAAHAGQLESLDVTLAVAAARYASEHETVLPLHLNLTADTVVAEAETLAPLHHALSGTGRQASQVVLEINPLYAPLKPELLLAGLHRLRQLGYRIALDGVGTGDYPLTVIAEARPDLIKMDREIVAGLPRETSCVAVLEALQQLASRIGAQVVAEGVERPEQVATLRQYGVGVAQGNLLAPPSRRPSTHLPISGIGEFRAPMSPAPARGLPGARITDYMHPAVTLPLSATGEDVHSGHDEPRAGCGSAPAHPAARQRHGRRTGRRQARRRGPLRGELAGRGRLRRRERQGRLHRGRGPDPGTGLRVDRGGRGDPLCGCRPHRRGRLRRDLRSRRRSPVRLRSAR